MGKAEGLLRIEQPPMHELTNLLQKLRKQSDTLTQIINRHVENTVDIANLETEIWDAFEFEALVITAKVKLKMMLTDAENNRYGLITSTKTLIRSELTEHRKSKQINSENTDAVNGKNNLVTQKHKGQYRPDGQQKTAVLIYVSKTSRALRRAMSAQKKQQLS